MGSIIPPGFGQIAIHYRLDGDNEDMVMTWGVTLTDVPTSTQLFNYYVSNVQQLTVQMCDSYEATAIKCSVGQDGGPPILVEAALADFGHATGDPLPQNCSVLIRKNTASGGRKNRGRCYWPGVQKAQVDRVGKLANAERLDWQDAANFLQVETDPPFGPMVVLHTDSTTPTEITTLLVENNIATQRRRLRP